MGCVSVNDLLESFSVSEKIVYLTFTLFMFSSISGLANLVSVTPHE